MIASAQLWFSVNDSGGAQPQAFGQGFDQQPVRARRRKTAAGGEFRDRQQDRRIRAAGGIHGRSIAKPAGRLTACAAILKTSITIASETPIARPSAASPARPATIRADARPRRQPALSSQRAASASSRAKARFARLRALPGTQPAAETRRLPKPAPARTETRTESRS